MILPNPGVLNLGLLTTVPSSQLPPSQADLTFRCFTALPHSFRMSLSGLNPVPSLPDHSLVFSLSWKICFQALSRPSLAGAAGAIAWVDLGGGSSPEEGRDAECSSPLHSLPRAQSRAEGWACALAAAPVPRWMRNLVGWCRQHLVRFIFLLRGEKNVASVSSICSAVKW